MAAEKTWVEAASDFIVAILLSPVGDGRKNGNMSDADTAVIERFLKLHAGPYDRARHGGPPWDDGSDAAALLAIWLCLEPMISNGGWPAVYYNRIGWSVPLAARGYRLIGMPRCAQRCEQAMAMVRNAEAAHPGEDYASYAWLSDGLMQAVGTSAWDLLDEKWFELTTETYERVARFVQDRGLAEQSR